MTTETSDLCIVTVAGMGDGLQLLPGLETLYLYNRGLTIDVVCDQEQADAWTLTGLPITWRDARQLPWRSLWHTAEPLDQEPPVHYHTICHHFECARSQALAQRWQPDRWIHIDWPGWHPSKSPLWLRCSKDFLEQMETHHQVIPPAYRATPTPAYHHTISPLLPPADKPYIVIAPTADNSRQALPPMLWPLIAAAISGTQQLQPVIINGPLQERDNPWPPADTTLPTIRLPHLHDAAYTIANSLAYIGGDTGLSHIAYHTMNAHGHYIPCLAYHQAHHQGLYDPHAANVTVVPFLDTDTAAQLATRALPWITALLAAEH